MKSFPPISMLVLLALYSECADADPILLATASGQSFTRTAPFVEAVQVTSFLRYQPLEGSGVSYACLIMNRS